MEEDQLMACYLADLKEQSRQSENDIRLVQYVIFINRFLIWFGNERVHLVGSTGEKTKLRYSKDDGDADFLMVSGIYEIDVNQLEFNDYNKCYLQIRANDKSKAIGLESVDDKYIAADSLREVKPELFTILRAIHAHLTASRDRLPEGDEDTVLSVSSKVGLATTRYRGLKLDDALRDRFKENRQGNRHSRKDEATKALAKRWKDVPIHSNDMQTLHRVLKIWHHMIAHRDGNPDISQVTFTTGLLEELMQRPQLSSVKLFYNVPTDSGKNGEEKETANDDQHDVEYHCVEPQSSKLDMSGVRNTYKDKVHMDFVPAMRLNGKLDIMKRWKDRAENAYMDSKLVEDIYETAIFVVSRVAPENSHFETDFCLSFNIAETKLVSKMSPMQRNVFLIMKAFLKGVFEIRHRKSSLDLKLKTYHMKTVLFWLFELNPELSFEDDTVENIMVVLRRAIGYLKVNLEDRMLPHYFVGANLFSDFVDDDYQCLGKCVDVVLKDPVQSIQYYLDLNDGSPCDLVFTAEAITCLLEMANDGGRGKHLDRIEDALVDLQRGINLSQRDAEMRAPIKEAVSDILRLFLEDEQDIDTKIFQQINKFLTRGRTKTTDDVNDQISIAVDLLNGFGLYSSDIKQFIDRFRGRPGLEQFLRGAFTGTPLDFSRALDEQLLETVDRYLSCADEEENKVAGELIYKLVGVFWGRKEQPRLSGLV